MILNLINGWYFMIDGKFIWDILQLMNKQILESYH